MIDLETMATEPGAVVLSIGACFFDIETGEINDTFYMCLDIGEQKVDGRIVDPATLAWWDRQSKDARRVFTEDKFPVSHVLDEFTNYVLRTGSMSKIHPWGNGSSFDISIMESLYRMYGKKLPWQFWNVTDLRTFRRFVADGIKVHKPIGTNHNALDDAINQANYVMKYGRG